MARYRRNKSGGIAEGVVGLLMLVGVLAVLSPRFREQVFSTVWLIFSLLLFLGILGLLWYLLRQLKAAKVEPVLTVAKNYPPVRTLSFSTTSQNFHPETPENLSIQSLQPKSSEVPKQNWNESILPSIEWKRFEIVTKEFLKMTGYEARETKIGADGGVDIRVTKQGAEGINGIVQCKAWNTYKVGVKPVRELFGVMAAEKVSNGMLITSGGFTAEAEEFAKGKLTLISGVKFFELIRKLSEEKQRKLLEVALKGDYRTPTCPQCDVKMIARESKKGRNVGGQFWGCVNYPRCRQTLVYKEQR